MRICHGSTGMERLQFAVERVRVRRSEGPADNTNETMEAGRVNVQQVSSFTSHSIRFDSILFPPTFNCRRNPRHCSSPIPSVAGTGMDRV